MLKIIIAFGSLGIGIIILLVFFYKARKNLSPDNKFLFISSLIFFLITFIVNFLPSNTSPDYKIKNRPYLEPELIVVSISSNSFSFYFDIQNKGRLPADNIKLIFSTPKSSGIDEGGDYPRQLASNGKMSLKHILFNEDITSITPTILPFDLYCIYTAQVNEKKTQFKSRFTFSIVIDHLMETHYTYSSATREEGAFTIKEQLKMIGLEERLSLPSGGFTFWVDITHHHSDISPTFFVKLPSKAIFYDPVTKSVIFQLKRYDEKEIILTQSLPHPENRWHFIGVSWTENSGMVSVDAHGYWVKEDGQIEKFSPPQKIKKPN